MAGHHYALVVVEDLEPGSTTPYEVRLDDVQVWPPADSEFPPSRIRTAGGPGPFRLAFGSCRYASPRTVEDTEGIPPDALDLYAQRSPPSRRTAGPTRWSCSATRSTPTS